MLRISNGDRWLCGDGIGGWIVYERKRYAHSTTVVLETTDEDTAIEALLDECDKYNGTGRLFIKVQDFWRLPIEEMEAGKIIVAVHDNTFSVSYKSDFNRLNNFASRCIAWCCQSDLVESAKHAITKKANG